MTEQLSALHSLEKRPHRVGHNRHRLTFVSVLMQDASGWPAIEVVLKGEGKGGPRNEIITVRPADNSLIPRAGHYPT